MKTQSWMSEHLLDGIYNTNQFDVQHSDVALSVGRITEKDKFSAAKQILLGLAILYVITLMAYMYRPIDGLKLLDICTTTFPPLATIILVAYFRDKSH